MHTFGQKFSRPQLSAVCGGLAFVLLALLVGAVDVHTVRASVHVRYFWVQRETGPQRTRCEMRASGRFADVYLCSGAEGTADGSRTLLTAYETLIRPTDLAVFGHPRGFGRIDILMTPLDTSTLGYFDENDILPTDPAHSNRANVIYVRPPNLMPDRNREMNVEEAVAHELQHLINYRIRVLDHHLQPEDPWLNEGLAFYAQMVNGYWTPRDELKVDASAGDPGWSVDGLTESNRFMYRHARVAYGRAGLFIWDLAQRYGRDFARSVVAAPDPGLQGVDSVLRHAHPSTTLPAAFAQWGVDLQLGRFPDALWDSGYAAHPRQQALAIPPVTLAPLAALPWRSGLLHVHPWAQSYLQFRASQPGTLRVSVAGGRAPLWATLIAQSTRGFARPRVAWCRSRGQSLSTEISDMGTLFDRATLVVSDTPRIGGPERSATIRVTANLVYGSDHNRVSRLTTTKGHKANVALRKRGDFR